MKDTASSRAFPWGAILFCIFLVLKLTGNISWSWWWVTAPLWIPVCLTLSIVVVIGLADVILNKIGLADVILNKKG